jgi:hypothetical protein
VKNNIQLYHSSNKNILRMSQSMIEAFSLTPELYSLLLKVYDVSSFNELMEQWIIESLMHPDDELAQVLLPQLVSRFNDHLEQMRRKEWLS